MVSRRPFEKGRGAIGNDIVRCTFCGICAARCPSRCIAVDKKKAAWQWDPFACVYCGVCVDSCKSGSLGQDNSYRRPTAVRELILLKGSQDHGKEASHHSQ